MSRDNSEGMITRAELLTLQESGQFPDEHAKITDVQVHSGVVL
jgi:hypothetical protein